MPVEKAMECVPSTAQVAPVALADYSDNTKSEILQQQRRGKKANAALCCHLLLPASTRRREWTLRANCNKKAKTGQEDSLLNLFFMI